MENKKYKFVIVSPRQKNGGPIVLHLLCKLLIEKGYDAKIFYTRVYGKKNESKLKFWLKWIGYTIQDTIMLVVGKILNKTKVVNKPVFKGYTYIPVRKYKRKFLPFISKDTIVIYPEICYGNFLNAKNVVRWFLYFNRFKGDKMAYGENDLFFTFRDIFNDTNLNPKKRTLKLNNFDSEMYKQTNFESRSGNCYIIRKGKDRDDLPKEFDGPILDSLTEKQIVENFNKYKYCFFYDTQTFYSSIAAICGCIPIVVCEPGKTRDDYLGNGEKGYGRAYNTTKEEIDFAINTKSKILEMIDGYEQNNQRNVDIFLNECKNFFGI